MQDYKKDAGFTLIELLAVIVIIGILATVLVILSTSALNNSGEDPVLFSSVSPGTRAMGLSDTLNGDLDDDGDTLDSSGEEVLEQAGDEGSGAGDDT